jgi:hypothetical protein
MNFQRSRANKGTTAISSRFVNGPEFLSTERKLGDFRPSLFIFPALEWPAERRAHVLRLFRFLMRGLLCRQV